MVQIDGGVPVSLRLVVTDRASEQLAPLDGDVFAAKVREPLPLGTASGAIVTCSMGVGLCGDNPFCECFLSCVLIDFAPELVRLLAVHPARFAPPFGPDLAESLEK